MAESKRTVNNPVNLTRILNGKITVRWHNFEKWHYIGVSNYWGGRLFYLHIGKLTFVLDCRVSVLKDMSTGVIE